LTKAAIEDVILRGEFSSWRGLVNAMRTDKTVRIAGRVREVAKAQGRHDARARAFATLLPRLLREPNRSGAGMAEKKTPRSGVSTDRGARGGLSPRVVND
jgi:hypothetical protein